MRSPLVDCGPVWGGKTGGLISRLVRARLQRVEVVAFNPAANTRHASHEIVAHSGARFPATPVERGAEILKHAERADVVGIDEIYMIPEIAAAVRTLEQFGKQIEIATLGMDSDGRVRVGAGDSYEPRCHDCWSAGQAERRGAPGQRQWSRTSPAND